MVVSGAGFSSSTKLISQHLSDGKPTVEYQAGAVSNGPNRLKNVSSIVEMGYLDGEILKYVGTAGDYKNVVTDIPTGDTTTTFHFVLCKDGEGRSYATIDMQSESKAYTRIWMAENLNVGTRVDGAVEQMDNGAIEKYCYGNDAANCDVYGGLYQWGEMIQYFNGGSNTTWWDPIPTGFVQGICPAGWHLPNDAEWCFMMRAYDVDVDCGDDGMTGSNIGGKLKETGYNHWDQPNTAATNSAGFTILPGGYRSSYTGTFNNLHKGADFWPSTMNSLTQAYDRYFYYNKAAASRTKNNKADGYSVRCMKDY